MVSLKFKRFSSLIHNNDNGSSSYANHRNDNNGYSRDDRTHSLTGTQYYYSGSAHAAQSSNRRSSGNRGQPDLSRYDYHYRGSRSNGYRANDIEEPQNMSVEQQAALYVRGLRVGSSGTGTTRKENVGRTYSMTSVSERERVSTRKPIGSGNGGRDARYNSLSSDNGYLAFQRGKQSNSVDAGYTGSRAGSRSGSLTGRHPNYHDNRLQAQKRTGSITNRRVHNGLGYEEGEEEEGEEEEEEVRREEVYDSSDGRTHSITITTTKKINGVVQETKTTTTTRTMSLTNRTMPPAATVSGRTYSMDSRKNIAAQGAIPTKVKVAKSKVFPEGHSEFIENEFNQFSTDNLEYSPSQLSPIAPGSPRSPRSPKAQITTNKKEAFQGKKKSKVSSPRPLYETPVVEGEEEEEEEEGEGEEEEVFYDADDSDLSLVAGSEPANLASIAAKDASKRSISGVKNTKTSLSHTNEKKLEASKATATFAAVAAANSAKRTLQGKQTQLSGSKMSNLNPKSKSKTTSNTRTRGKKPVPTVESSSGYVTRPPISEAEMYAAALEIAKQRVYGSSGAPPVSGSKTNRRVFEAGHGMEDRNVEPVAAPSSTTSCVPVSAPFVSEVETTPKKEGKLKKGLFRFRSKREKKQPTPLLHHQESSTGLREEYNAASASTLREDTYSQFVGVTTQEEEVPGGLPETLSQTVDESVPQILPVVPEVVSAGGDLSDAPVNVADTVEKVGKSNHILNEPLGKVIEEEEVVLTQGETNGVPPTVLEHRVEQRVEQKATQSVPLNQVQETSPDVSTRFYSPLETEDNKRTQQAQPLVAEPLVTEPLVAEPLAAQEIPYVAVSPINTGKESKSTPKLKTKSSFLHKIVEFSHNNNGPQSKSLSKSQTTIVELPTPVSATPSKPKRKLFRF